MFYWILSLVFMVFASVPFVVFVIFKSSSCLATTAAPLLSNRFVFIVFEMFVSIRMVIWNACVYWNAFCVIYNKRVWAESGDVRSSTILYFIWSFLNIKMFVRLECFSVLKWYLRIVWYIRNTFGLSPRMFDPRKFCILFDIKIFH